jgi:hypothetical protein
MGEESPQLEGGWELMERLILEMNKTVESNDGQFLIFTTDRDEVYRQWMLMQEWMYTDNDGDYIIWDNQRYPINWKRQLENLTQLSRTHQIHLIKPIRSYPRYLDNSHPNPDGNLNMAKDIFEYLTTNEFLALE